MEIQPEFKPQAATLIVAASDSLHPERADYYCDGTDDDVQIQAAIDALPASGGKVELMEGTFTTTSAIQMKSNVILSGQGNGSTIIQTSTNNINVIELHGASLGSILNTSGLKDLKISGVGSPTSYGLSLLYNSTSIFENLYIYGFDGYGIHIEVGWDNNWSNIIVHTCGSNSSSEPAVFLTDDGVDNTNNQHFFDLHIEPFRYRALSLDTNTHSCSFHDLKCHGNDGTTNRDGIVVTGNYNIFDTAHILKIGTAYTSIIVNGINNIFENIVFLGASGLCFDINSKYTIINNVIIYGGASKTIVNGIDISETDCQISNILIQLLHGWGITISNDLCNVSNISLTTIDEEGIILTGNRCMLSNISPSWVGIDTGESMRITGDFNVIFGGHYSGPGAKTIQFDAGSNHNRLIGVRTTKAVIDNGSGNNISDTYSNLFMDVLAISSTHVRSNEDLSVATPITFTLDAQPDVPRTLSWSFDTHAQITEYDMEVIGIDAKGNSVTETWDETAGWSGETSNAFATIISIKMTSRTGTGAADTMDIGITDVLGLSNIIYATSDVFKIKKNNANATVATAQVNTTYDTYDMSVIGLGVGDDFTIWYKSNLNIIS